MMNHSSVFKHFIEYKTTMNHCSCFKKNEIYAVLYSAIFVGLRFPVYIFFRVKNGLTTTDSDCI